MQANVLSCLKFQFVVKSCASDWKNGKQESGIIVLVSVPPPSGILGHLFFALNPESEVDASSISLLSM